MTEEGEPDRQQTVKSLLSPHLRSFPHRGPAAFSRSGRPHPPPLGEGTGEGVLSYTDTGKLSSSRIQSATGVTV